MSELNSIGFKPCWKLVPKGRCRLPIGHDGDHNGCWWDGDRLHRWKMSWPGNSCLDCGYGDPSEDIDKSLVNCKCTGTAGCDACGFTGCLPNPNLEVESCPGPPFIVFLDFDGVLHPMTGAATDSLFEQSKRLKQILTKYPNVYVVIHSSWRFSHAYSEEDLWDFLEMGDTLRPRYLGITPVAETGRWESIQSWMKTRSYTGAYAILDDMYTSFDYQGQDHLICPHYAVGMLEEDWQELERRIDACLQS